MKQKAGKRIVSKREYARLQGKRISIGVSAFGLFVMLVLCFMMVLACSGIIIVSLLDSYNKQVVIVFCFRWLVFLVPASHLLAQATRHTFLRARQIDPGVPLTRSNTAHLPAETSLVRASQETLQFQDTVLLRAAAETKEQQEWRLLRALVGRNR